MVRFFGFEVDQHLVDLATFVVVHRDLHPGVKPTLRTGRGASPTGWVTRLPEAWTVNEEALPGIWLAVSTGVAGLFHAAPASPAKLLPLPKPGHQGWERLGHPPLFVGVGVLNGDQQGVAERA